MPREISLSEHPVIAPGVCAKCGTQKSSWFVDLGFDSVFNYHDEEIKLNTWCDGVVYLCAECTNSFMEDLHRAFSIYKRNEARALTPLKMIPITLNEREEVDGDSGQSSGDNSDDSDGVDSDDSVDEPDDGEPVIHFTIPIAQAV